MSIDQKERRTLTISSSYRYVYVIVGGRFPWSKPSVQRTRTHTLRIDHEFDHPSGSDLYSLDPDIKKQRELLYSLDPDIKKQREMLQRMDAINEVAHLFLVTKNLARSEAALHKLSELLGEADNSVEKTVLPVFYGVDPSDVRHQTGSFAQAFADHEKKYKDDPQKVKRWRAALTKLGNLSGWVSKDCIQHKLMNSRKASLGLFIFNGLWSCTCFNAGQC